MDGILVIDKPKNWTSRDVVNQVCKIMKTKKVGHTGTLDPLATGVLVVCVGKATKVCEFLTSFDKEYEAEVLLGVETDTIDLEGNIIKEELCFKSREEIENAISNFPKKYMQEVPIYSAIKVNGKKLYEYAREKEQVSLPKKEVEIKKISLLEYKINTKKQVQFKIKCTVSKGTYIRSLIRDLAYSMNTVAVMTDLKRTKQGNFDIKDAYSIEDLKEGKINLYSIEDYLPYDKIEVNDFLKTKIMNGQKLQNRYNNDILFTYNGKALALYKETDDRKNIKPWKMFI